MNQLANNNLTEKMTSSQMAEMLGYEKKEVNRKIKSMFGQKIDGGIITPSLDSRGYVDEYHLPELESKMFVAKHDIDYLEKITTYWINRNEVKKLPTTKELALMVIQAEEAKEQAMLEVDRLQGVCNTITAQFATGMTATKFCKTLNGVNTQQVNNTLIEMGKLRRTDKGIVPVAYTRDRYFKEAQKTHNGKLRCHSEITLLGAKWLYRAYLSGKLPMKANWDKVNSHVVFN